MSNLETKSLSSLETSDSLNDGDKVLIERDGDMVKVDSSAIGNDDIEIPVPDWNVNNSSEPGYIDNRPFYDFDNEIEVFSPTDIEFANQGMPGVIYKQYNGGNTPRFSYVSRINPGDYLIVNVDGVNHELLVIQRNDYDFYAGGYNPGDAQILTNGVGIFFQNIPGNPSFVQIVGFYLAEETTGTHTISVRYKFKDIVTIPTKYLATTLLVRVAKSSQDATITSTHTRSEIIAALNEGKRVMLYHVGNKLFYSLTKASMAGDIYLDYSLYFFAIYEEDEMVQWSQIYFLNNDSISETHGHFS